jgi:hypothetical protein
VKIKVWVKTDKIGSTVQDEIEISPEDLGMEPGAELTLDTNGVEEMARDTMFNMIEWSYDLAEES